MSARVGRSAWLAALVAAALAAYFVVRAPHRDAASASGSAAPSEGSAAAELAGGSHARRSERAPSTAAEAPQATDATGEGATNSARALVVEVVDASGVAVAGQEVVLARAWEFEPRRARGATTDAVGRARIELPREVPFGGPVLAVAAVGAFERSHAKRVDVAAPPAGPLRMVLDVGGALEVTVTDDDGRPLEHFDACAVAAETHDRRVGQDPFDAAFLQSRVTTTEVGVARIEPVQRAVPLIVIARRARDGALLRTRVDGPPPHETRNVALSFAGDAVVFTGRAFGDAGLAGLQWWTIDLGRRAPFVVPEATNREGERFSVRLAPERAARLGEDAWLVLGAPMQPWAWFPLAGRLAPGVHELGDVHAPIGEVIADGTARFDDGRPFTGELELEARRPGGKWVPAWANGSVKPDARGAFAFAGRGETSLEWRIAPYYGGTVLRPEAFMAGTRGLEVVIASRKVLRGRVLVDAELGSRVRAVAVVVAPVGDAFKRIPAMVAADGTFACEDPPQPTCLVTVRAQWSDEVVLEQEVDVAGARGDPTVEFDLRGKLRVVELTARGPDGAPLAFSLRERGTNPGYAVVEIPKHVLLLHRWPVDLVAGARGYRDVEVRGVDGPRVVEFGAPGLSLVLRWPSMPQLGAEVRLRPTVLPADRFDPDVLHVSYGAGDELFGEGGEARVVVPSPGPHVVLLHVDRVTDRGRSSTMLWKAPPVIDVADVGGEQVLDVEFPVDEVVKRAEMLRH